MFVFVVFCALFIDVIYTDVFACEGKEEAPRVTPGSVEELQKHAVQAPVGMLDRTEVNLEVPKMPIFFQVYCFVLRGK